MKIRKDETLCLKGIMAILVLIHHLYQYSGILHGNILGAVFQDMGYVAVAVFFFLSGYGLSVSYRIKSQAYLKHFLRNRVVLVYCFSLFLIVLYAAYELSLGNSVSVKLILQSLTLGQTIIKFGWYLQTTLLLYVAYYLVFSRKWKDNTKYISMIGVVIVYSAICVFLDFSLTRYITVINFVLGMLFEYKSVEKQKGGFLLKYLCYIIGLAILFLVYHITDMIVVKELLLMLLSICFTIVVIMTIKIVKIDCKVTRFLGNISLEIYVIQGLFLSLFHSKWCYINNPYIYIVVVIVCTIFFAWILNMIFDMIAKVVVRKS